MSLVDTRSGSVSRAPRPSSLADVLDLILDKGLVIDAYVRVSVAGIELLTIDARVVVASVDTYLRFAEAVNRLDLTPTEERGIDALTGRDEEQGEEEGDGEEPEHDKSKGEARAKREEAPAGRRSEPTGDDGDGKQGGLIGRLADRARFEQ